MTCEKMSKQPSSDSTLASEDIYICRLVCQDTTLEGRLKPKGQTQEGAMPEVGKKVPDFALESDAGDIVSLGDFLGRTLVLYFYPKDDTPG